MYLIVLLFVLFTLHPELNAQVTDNPGNRVPSTSPAPGQPLLPDQDDTTLIQATLRRFPRAIAPHAELPTYSESDSPDQKFRIYHTCLREKNLHGREIPRAAKLRQEGQEVELSCNVWYVFF